MNYNLQRIHKIEYCLLSEYRVEYQEAIARGDIKRKAELELIMDDSKLELEERIRSYFHECNSRSSLCKDECRVYRKDVSEKVGTIPTSDSIPFIDNTVWLEGGKKQ